MQTQPFATGARQARGFALPGFPATAGTLDKHADVTADRHAARHADSAASRKSTPEVASSST